MSSTRASYLLGYDCGSSSVKASIIDADTGQCVASAFAPLTEMPISSAKPGYAEQDPEMWWDNLVRVTALLREKLSESDAFDLQSVRAVGVAYQMHGLVLLDKKLKLLRPSIIWCDSRAVEIGNRAYHEIGHVRCLSQLKNPPGNFTASRYRWVIENEAEIAERTHKLMLPGDYIAFRLTGEVQSTISGLSEMILWDYMKGEPADLLLKHFKISPTLLPSLVPTFGIQGKVRDEVARELGIPPNTPVSYRAGDQPNNAFALSAFHPGEVAAAAGTSGVIYAVSDSAVSDSRGRVNTFVHVNHTPENPRFGVLLCVNGCGVLYSWLRKMLSHSAALPSYDELNNTALQAPIGSSGLVVLPYGNGAERSLENQDFGASVHNLHFLNHSAAHLIRASQEGIAYALSHGIEILKKLGLSPRRLKCGDANLFHSSIFRDALAGATGCTIEIVQTDGAQGAARAAGLGAGFYASPREAAVGLQTSRVVEPAADTSAQYQEAYHRWREILTGHQLEHENRRSI